MILLGLDPGFANFGYAKVRYGQGYFKIAEMGVIETQKDTRKVLNSVDNVKRAGQIHLALRALIWTTWETGELVRVVDALCVEAQSWPRNAGSAAKVAMAWGVIASICADWELPLVQRSPQQIKMAVVGSRKASKAEMAATLAGRYPEVLTALSGVPQSRREHPYDALGAVVASLDDEVIKMGMRQ